MRPRRLLDRGGRALNFTLHSLGTVVIQIRRGDVIAIQADGLQYVAIILSKKMLFGGNWCFIHHNARPVPSVCDLDADVKRGFYAFVDFNVPKREGRTSLISRGNDISRFARPRLLQQSPARGETRYSIWCWEGENPRGAKHLRATSSPSPEELSLPHYSCFPADWACRLAARRWTVDQSPYDAPNNRWNGP